ncbi:MAG: hypothetical protein H6R15_2231 [Proteobacteria bacterium]|nr:hypothetical protein [Pseudomonadota bacterium]
MSALRELQTDFAAAMFAGDAAKLLAHCAGDPERARQGIAAYRRSVLANLAAAVQATYPVSENIVGGEFLAAACRRYAESHPSRSGDLNAYGDQFAALLADYAAAASLPYLPDVARLEWLILQVHGAEDAPAQDLSRLATAPPESWGELRFRLDPAHALLASRWPVVRIWEVNQPDNGGDFAVDFRQPENALIQRRPAGIAVERLGAGEQALLAALQAANTLGEAVEQAISDDEDFDLQGALQRFIGNGLLRLAY